MASSHVGPSKNAVPVKITNTSNKSRVIKKGEVLATCPPASCIDRNLRLTTAESSETLKVELLKAAELNADETSVAENLIIEFQDSFSRIPHIVCRTKMT